MIILLTGKNCFARDDYIKSRIAEFAAEFGSESIERLYAGDTSSERIIETVQSTSFLSPKKLIILKEPEANSELLDNVEQFIERTAEENTVLVIADKLDKRKTYYKILLKNAEIFECKELDPLKLSDWAVLFARENGYSLSKNDANYLIQRVGTDQQLVASEILKLGTCAVTINREIIDVLTEQSLQSTIFSLLDTLFNDDVRQAIAKYQELRAQQLDPKYITAMISWQLQIIALAKTAQPQNESTVVSAGVSPFVAQKALKIAKSITHSKLREIIELLIEVDKKMRTNVDKDSTVELFLMSIAK